METFCEKNGRPKYYNNRTYPVDSQCASQAIDTLANFSEYSDSALELAQKVANWTIDDMQDKDGYFYLVLENHVLWAWSESGGFAFNTIQR